MFIPTNSEFVTLCQSQVSVLTQGLGATLSAVYLTDELVDGAEAKLIPIVVYPEATALWEEDNPNLMLPEQMSKLETMPRQARGALRLLPQGSKPEPGVEETASEWGNNALRRQRPLVFPLMHEGVVLGLLVAGREDRPWSEREQATIERIARTLTIAYVLEQRRAWFEQQLTQARHQQREQHDRLDDLLHQFRNPLTALRTFGKLLLKRFRPGDKNLEAAASIVRESDRLQELLKEFDACLDRDEGDLEPLTLPAALISEPSRLASEAYSEEVSSANTHPKVTLSGFPQLPGSVPVLEPFEVAAVLEPLLVSAKAIAQERNLALHTYIPTRLPPVQGNPKLLREVLSNLIDNALKYTPAGGQIEVRVSKRQHTQHAEAVAIAISDTGPGIPSQDFDHLFERHYRGIQATTGIPGSGLGLAIAKELIEQMQGQIDVFSPAQAVWTKHDSDQGTTFVVWLPLAGLDLKVKG